MAKPLHSDQNPIIGDYLVPVACPICQKVSRVANSRADAVNCGDCLMDRIEVVKMQRLPFDPDPPKRVAKEG